MLLSSQQGHSPSVPADELQEPHTMLSSGSRAVSHMYNPIPTQLRAALLCVYTGMERLVPTSILVADTKLFFFFFISKISLESQLGWITGAWHKSFLKQSPSRG